MLKRAEPPICVGLYARWGSGKTFMISLLKKEFDSTVREDPNTRQLLQFFEEGYDKLGPNQAPAFEEKVSSLICGLLLTIVWAFVPYGATTFGSIIFDAFDPREAFHAAGAWCSKLMHACTPGLVSNWLNPCAKTAPSDQCCGLWPWAKHPPGYQKLPQPPEGERAPGATKMPKQMPKETKEKKKEKEFIFVDFNAWECATCVHLSVSTY